MTVPHRASRSDSLSENFRTPLSFLYGYLATSMRQLRATFVNIDFETACKSGQSCNRGRQHCPARGASYFSWLDVRRSLSGSPNARYSPEYGPPLTATTMNCLPSTV